MQKQLFILRFFSYSSDNIRFCSGHYWYLIGTLQYLIDILHAWYFPTKLTWKSFVRNIAIPVKTMNNSFSWQIQTLQRYMTVCYLWTSFLNDVFVHVCCNCLCTWTTWDIQYDLIIELHSYKDEIMFHILLGREPLTCQGDTNIDI